MSADQKGEPNPEGFRAFLLSRGMSENTIRAYEAAVRQYFKNYSELSFENLRLYKVKLIECRRPQTVNARIRALNCYMEYCGITERRLKMVRIQRKTYLERMISQGDYEYLKRRLWEDGELSYFYLIRVLAGTGVRVGEVTRLTAADVSRGYKDLYSKGNKIRRIYLPHSLSREMELWLASQCRREGPVFLNRFGRPISPGGIRFQLKTFARRYGLNPELIHPHAFRHLFAKSFIEKSGDLSLLADLLGHENIETTRIYLQRSHLEQQQILNQVIRW